MVKRLTTGFRNFDEITGGFAPPELTVIASRPAMGKTSFALRVLANVTNDGDTSAIYFTLEESKIHIAEKLLSVRANLLDGKIFIEDTATSIAKICDRCKQVKDEHGLDLVVIDYLQLIGGTGKATSRKEEVAEIIYELKNLARELDCAVIILSQLSSSVETRLDKCPRLADLSDSGVIAEEVDAVLLLYREEYYRLEPKRKNSLEVVLAKHPCGRETTIELLWDKVKIGCSIYNSEKLTLASTIKLMLSSYEEDIILADYLQVLIKIDALKYSLNIKNGEDEMNKVMSEELENLNEYRNIVLRKLVILGVDIEREVEFLTDPHRGDVVRYLC